MEKRKYLLSSIPILAVCIYLSTLNLACSLQDYSDTGPAPTLQDKAIDSYGVSIELVRFLGIRSRCTSNAANVSEYTHELEDDTGDYEDSDDEAETNNLSDLTLPPAHLQPTGTSKGKPVLESHPYIVSQWVASSDYMLIFII